MMSGCYSSRNAVVGSIRDALSAGMSDAAIAMAERARGMMVKVQASDAVTP